MKKGPPGAINEGNGDSQINNDGGRDPKGRSVRFTGMNAHVPVKVNVFIKVAY